MGLLQVRFRAALSGHVHTGPLDGVFALPDQAPAERFKLDDRAVLANAIVIVGKRCRFSGQKTLAFPPQPFPVMGRNQGERRQRLDFFRRLVAEQLRIGLIDEQTPAVADRDLDAQTGIFDQAAKPVLTVPEGCFGLPDLAENPGLGEKRPDDADCGEYHRPEDEVPLMSGCSKREFGP